MKDEPKESVASDSSFILPPSSFSVAAEYYRLWDATTPTQPGPRDLEQAKALEHDRPEAMAVIACLVRVTKKRWPDCRSLSGAVQKYLPDAVRLHQLERRRKRRPAQTAEVERRQGTGSGSDAGAGGAAVAGRLGGDCRRRSASAIRLGGRSRGWAARRPRRRSFSGSAWRSWRGGRPKREGTYEASLSHRRMAAPPHAELRGRSGRPACACVGTEIDSWNGKTFLSVVGFLFLGTRVLGVPVPLFIAISRRSTCGSTSAAKPATRPGAASSS